MCHSPCYQSGNMYSCRVHEYILMDCFSIDQEPHAFVTLFRYIMLMPLSGAFRRNAPKLNFPSLGPFHNYSTTIVSRVQVSRKVH